MKNQYVGDIGDYGKYGLLRFLAKQGIKLGINWYLTANDGSRGRKFTDYLKQSSERVYDPELFDALRAVAFRDDKTVRLIESAGLIPDAEFFAEPLKTGLLDPRARKCDRRLWFNNSTLLLRDTDLIFADPDNGITYTKTASNKGSEKFILPDEVCDYYSSGKNVVFYCHKGRRKPDAWEQAKTEIRKYIHDAQILAVTCHRGTQRSYIFVLHPADHLRYEQILQAFLATAWGRMFIWEKIEGNAYPSSEPQENANKIVLEPLGISFSVCKVADYSGVDLEKPFVFTGSTDEEKSLVCPTDQVPENALIRENGWKAFRIRGVLDFSLIGILAGITRVLAERKIGVFVISTYNTDYVMTKEAAFEDAKSALKGAGYTIA